MKQAATRELYAYWNHLRGDRTSPDRSQINPSAIRGILADTFILEIDADQDYRFRLSGTRLNTLFLQELKGKAFPGFWRGQDCIEMQQALRLVCQEASGIVGGVSAAPRSHDPIDLEILLLPVRHFGRTHTRVLGCLTPVRLAAWIGLLPVEHLTLKGLRMLPRGVAERASEESAPEAGPAEIASHRPLVERRGHLVLHDFTR